MVLATSLMATGAGARDLRVAPGVPDDHPAHYMYERFAEYLEEASGGTMAAVILDRDEVAMPQMMDALQTNLIDIGNFPPQRFPKGMESTIMPADLALMGKNPYAMALAMTEYVVTCKPCQKEFSRAGLVYLGSGSSGVYGLLTTTPVGTAQDLEGLKLRAETAPHARWAENFGAEPVELPDGAVFQAMSRGVIDGTIARSVDLDLYRFFDVVDHVTLLPLGLLYVTSNFTVARPAWEALTEEERAFLTGATARANLDLTTRWAEELPMEVAMTLMEKGVEAIEPDPTLHEASEAFIRADTAARVAQGGAAAERFVELVEKWTGIVYEARGDLDALTAAADAEIWSKVDWSTYGG